MILPEMIFLSHRSPVGHPRAPKVIHGKGGVTLREERGPGQAYRLYLHGRRTGVRFDRSVITSNAPEMTAAQTSSGIVFGTVWQIQSGATLTSGSFAFISDHGRYLTRPADQVQGSGRRVLLIGDGNADKEDPFVTIPQLYEGGRFRPIGPATKVHLEASGRVTGWCLVDGRNRPYTGGLESSEPLFRRYFVWKDGARFQKGREQDR